ncbi:MAG TPA: peptidylprolyl isomerase [Nitrospiria bacterium]|jgi:peptidyl-prolyl cis-trans isomerase C|nr:peptidylprolyl isomerase [Nitrospiria bacterium]
MRSTIVLFCFMILLLAVSNLKAQELANVNGTSISMADFQARLNELPPDVRQSMVTAEGKKDFLENHVIPGELLLGEAKREGLEKDKEIAKKVEDARRGVLINAAAQKIVAEKVTDEAAKKYYEQHSQEFKEVHASHILVATEEEAKNIKKQLDKGADFSELVKKHSTDPSAAQNAGDLGFFTRDQMVKPFTDKAFSMKVNQISDPVKTQFGYHIIKVIEIRPAKKFGELDESRVVTVKRAIFNEEMDKLKAKAKITVHAELLKTDKSPEASGGEMNGTKSKSDH